MALLPLSARANIYMCVENRLKFLGWSYIFFPWKWQFMCFCVKTGGSDGLLAQKTLEITDEVLSSYKNQGGYDMLGRTKDQIRTTEQVNGAMASCQALKLDALVIIGGM